MALNPKFSTGFRNALIDGGDITTMFNSGELHIYSGAQPADADATEGAGTLLVTITLPAANAFAASAVSGQIAKAGTWSAATGAGGTAAWFRMYDSAVTTGASTTAVRIDGTVDLTTGDLIPNAVALVATDIFIVDTFAIALAA